MRMLHPSLYQQVWEKVEKTLEGLLSDNEQAFSLVNPFYRLIVDLLVEEATREEVEQAIGEEVRRRIPVEYQARASASFIEIAQGIANQ